MKKNVLFLILISLFIYSCGTYELKEQQKYDYTTSGALSDDCFQVIITMAPDTDIKTMSGQRENAFIKAKNSINSEIEKQVLLYYSKEKSINSNNIDPEKITGIKFKSDEYSKLGIIEQEYYLIDNSAVLVYRIFKNGIKKEILSY